LLAKYLAERVQAHYSSIVVGTTVSTTDVVVYVVV
jgi:hypothetical protein